MKITLYASFAVASLVPLALSGTATGQVSDAIRKRVLEQKRRNEQTQNQQPRTQSRRRSSTSTARDARCESYVTLNRQNKNRLAAYRGELSGIDSEMRQLKARLAELESERRRTLDSVKRLNTQIQRNDGVYKNRCSANQSCQTYESDIERLGAHAERLDRNATSVREEIRDSKNRLATLRRTIVPLRSEYNRLKCNDLVPGETQQNTIDRCAQIFSDWNQQQAELNRYNQRVPSLRHRYETLLSQLNAADDRAKSAEAYLSRNCRGSRQLGTVRALHRRREAIRRVGDDLNALAKSISDLRKLRITVTAGSR